MIRGEYLVLEDGIWRTVPNQLTVYGAVTLLRAAFQGVDTTWEMGMCLTNPADHISTQALREPTQGVNGYARQTLGSSAIHWPEISSINGEAFVESRSVEFDVSGPTDKPVNRLFIAVGGQVVSVSSALWPEPQAPDSIFTTKYRIYLK